MASSNGGTSSPLNLYLIPLSTPVPQFLEFDTTNFNDALQGSFYFWKVEPIIEGRTATCNRVIITYRDLGVVNLTAILSGFDQNSQSTVVQMQAFTLGTVAATGKVCTTPPNLLSLSLTAMNLQFNIARVLNAGPVSIIKVRLEGEVETTSYS